jgi:hypothetical protein
MDKAELQKMINSKEELFLKKLKYAGLNELEYWEKRPENLSREILVKYLSSIDETKELFPEMSVRESDGGKYGETGFKWVFKFKDSFIVMGRKTEIYIKGFFFEENDPRGIEVQSFKKDTVLKVL